MRAVESIKGEECVASFSSESPLLDSGKSAIDSEPAPLQPIPVPVPGDQSHQPNNKLFSITFRRAENTAALLQAKLPQPIAEAIDWSQLRRQPGSFIDSHFSRSHTDLLFSAPLAGRDCLIYLLFEHVILRVPRRVLQLVLRYILGTDLDRESFEARVAKLNDPGTRSAAMTLAQHYRQEGRQEGRQEYILEVLAIRFGRIPEGMGEAVHGIEDDATLQKLLRTAIQCQSLEAFAQAI